jgi:hypothetical protein
MSLHKQLFSAAASQGDTEIKHITLEFRPIVITANVRTCIQKFPDWVDNEIHAYNNKHTLRSNTKGYGGKTH